MASKLGNVFWCMKENSTISPFSNWLWKKKDSLRGDWLLEATIFASYYLLFICSENYHCALHIVFDASTKCSHLFLLQMWIVIVKVVLIAFVILNSFLKGKKICHQRQPYLQVVKNTFFLKKTNIVHCTPFLMLRPNALTCFLCRCE